MILFLCTGNYYRSRFAEELFNGRAEACGLPWRADSRAVAIERGINNVGPISALALDALAARGVRPRNADRAPRSCTETDLEAAHLRIALSETEHRPLMRERFPAWESRTEYWHAEDIAWAPAEVALGSIAERIEAMLVRLRAAGGLGGPSPAPP
jgi:protein-tyrosine phosphatase